MHALLEYPSEIVPLLLLSLTAKEYLFGYARRLLGDTRSSGASMKSSIPASSFIHQQYKQYKQRYSTRHSYNT